MKDILHALQNPTAGSPLAPLTDTKTKALKTIAELLHNKSNTVQQANTNKHDPPVQRVPKAPLEPNTNPNEPTYHQSNKPKKQTNKHKQQHGKLAATDDAALATLLLKILIL